MIEWRDEGILLTVRRHGESAAIIDAFTPNHGRHAGLVRGGASRKMTPVLQPGAQLSLEWRARLEEHLGGYKVEPIRSRAGVLLADGDALEAMNSVAALLSAYLAEREAHPHLFAATVALLDCLGVDDGWPEAYVAWELAFLSDLGYPLDLSACASTGALEELIWVSPRTGRAVSRKAGAPYADRLLPLPAFLTGAQSNSDGVSDGLRMTGHFLKHWVAPAFGGHSPPQARDRFEARMRRRNNHEDGL
jgi:DNA repair protein RecO (recombination protein O)